MSPVWSPDSRSLLLVSSRGGGRDVYRIAIGDRGEPVSEMDRLTNGANVGTISLAANGSRLAYSVFTNTANIWSVAIPQTGTVSVRDAEPVTRGTQHIEGLDVTPDGQWLTFDSDRGGNVDIYKMRLDGAEPIQLTTDPSDDFIPAWSPDGRWIVFHSWRHGNRDVFVISSDGGVADQVTSHSAHDYYGKWSPDGMRLAFFSERSGGNEIFTVERTKDDGWTSPERLPVQGGLFPDWSLDGSALAYMHGDGLHLYSLTDGSDRLLFAGFDRDSNAFTTAFSRYAPDGRTIYVKLSTPGGEQSIWAVPVAGGPARLVVVFDDPSQPSSRQEFATDGERLYFTIDNRQSDIWVMEVEGWE